MENIKLICSFISMLFPLFLAFHFSKKYNIIHGIITFYSFSFIMIISFRIIGDWLASTSQINENQMLIKNIASYFMIDINNNYTSIDFLSDIVLKPVKNLVVEMDNAELNRFFNDDGMHLLLFSSIIIFFLSHSVSSIFYTHRRNKMYALKMNSKVR